MTVRHDQSRTINNAKNHSGTDCRAPEIIHPLLNLNQHVGHHRAVEVVGQCFQCDRVRLELVDVQRKPHARRAAHLKQHNRPPRKVGYAQQNSASGQPGSPSLERMFPHQRQPSQHNGNQTCDNSEQRNAKYRHDE